MKIRIATQTVRFIVVGIWDSRNQPQDLATVVIGKAYIGNIHF